MKAYSTFRSQTETHKPTGFAIAAADGADVERVPAFVAFELLTAGYNQEIIDLGAVRYERGEEVASYSTFINPGKALPPEALEGTGIKSSTLARAPGLSEAIIAFDALTKGAVLLAHGDSCNMWLLRGAYESAGRPLNHPTADAHPVTRQVYDILRGRYPYPDDLIGDFIAPPVEPYRAVDCARFLGAEFLRALGELDKVPDTYMGTSAFAELRGPDGSYQKTGCPA